MSVLRHPVYLTPLLLTLLFFKIHSLSTPSAGHSQNLRQSPASKRILGTPVTLQCSSSASNCHETGSIGDTEMAYRISLGPQASMTIDFDLKKQKEVNVDFGFGSYGEMQVSIEILAPDSVKDGIIIRTNSDWKSAIPIKVTSDPSKRFTVTITSPYNEQTEIDFKVTHSEGMAAWIIPVAVSCGVLLAIIIAVLYFYFGCGKGKGSILDIIFARHDINDAHPQPDPSQSAQPIHLEVPDLELSGNISMENKLDSRFPEAKFEDMKISFAQKTCSICLEDLQGSQLCRQLYCEHIFHSECMRLWLENQLKTKTKSFCPNCNEEILRVDQKNKD